MSLFIHAKPGPVIMGRMNRGEDLLDTLTRLVRENSVTLGRIEGLGAVERATLAYYDQVRRVYATVGIDQRCEITHLVGNISLKNGEPMVHAHVTLADEAGRAFGGHLLQGTPVFACEFCIQRLDGPALIRGHDEDTGLPLWEMPAGD